MDKFHKAPPSAKLSIVPEIQDSRFRSMASRLVHLEWPKTEPPHVRQRYDEGMKARLFTDENVPWLTHGRARESVDLLLTGDASTARLLSDREKEDIQGYLARKGGLKPEEKEILVDYRRHLEGMSPPKRDLQVEIAVEPPPRQLAAVAER